MGRMIDETNLMNLLYALDDARHDLCYAIKKIPELPTVEAIPKDQYEARLKADMVAMLEDLKQDIIAEAYGIETDCSDYVVNVADIDMVIRQKINELKEHTDGKDN